MLSETQINDLMMRTRRYPYSDGLTDFGMAVMWLVSGVILWVLYDVRQTESTASALALLLIPVTVLISWRPVMNAVRRRWLWRASGWVEAHSIGVGRWVFVLAGVVWVGSNLLSHQLLKLGLVDDWFVLHMFIVAMGWGTATFMIASGVYLKLWRYTIAGIVGALAITPLLFTQATFGQTFLINGLVWGILQIITGTLTLRRALMRMEDATA